MQANSTPSIQAMIIAVADSNHYLVGVVDSNNDFIGLGQGPAEVVDSIVAAKAYLRGNNIFSALLEMDSAYDEMCGQSVSARYRQRILC